MFSFLLICVRISAIWRRKKKAEWAKGPKTINIIEMCCVFWGQSIIFNFILCITQSRWANVWWCSLVSIAPTGKQDNRMLIPSSALLLEVAVCIVCSCIRAPEIVRTLLSMSPLELCDYMLTLLNLAFYQFVNSNSEPPYLNGKHFTQWHFHSSMLDVVKDLEDTDASLLSENFNSESS